MNLTHWAYPEQLDCEGIRFYRHQKGFMHQKVVLIDDDYATVGTANFDNRSFRLNFEITLLVADRQFNLQVASMLESDLEDCRPVEAGELAATSFWFRFAVRAAQLTAPLQ